MNTEKAKQRIFELFDNRFGFRDGEIKLTSRLFHDLGIDGSDAEDLFKILEEEFSVDLQHLLINDFFGEEAGCNPIVYLYSIIFNRKSLRKKPLFISDIIKVVETKKWPEKTYFDSRKRTLSFL